jgi:hypothetical protein
MAVEFISNGYDTTSTNPYTETAWANAFPSIGLASYGVRSPLDWKVTAVAGQDRTVSIASGRGFGHGVTDLTYANETIQLDTISAGSRWDLIAVRRDWNPTAGVTKFVKVNGGATAVVPGGRLAEAGNIDDQPIALVQVTAGQTQPTAIIDLRTWVGDGGGLIAEHDLVRTFLNATGTRIRVDGVDWTRAVGDNDTPVWVKTGETGKVPLFGSTGGRAGGTPPADTQFLMQTGSTVLPQEVNGYGTVWLPKVFPNGLLSATVTNGDIKTTGRGWQAAVNAADTTALYVNLSNGSGAGYSAGAWRCDWIAYGW